VREDSELPAELPAEFWARKTIKDLFVIDPDFRRAEVLQLWPDLAGRSPGIESTVTAAAVPSVLTCEPGAEPDQLGAGQGAPTAAGARTRGPRGYKRRLVIDAMKGDIRENRLTPGQLKDMLEKQLMDKYGHLAASRETLRKARQAVLSESEFVGISKT